MRSCVLVSAVTLALNACALAPGSPCASSVECVDTRCGFEGLNTVEPDAPLPTTCASFTGRSDSPGCVGPEGCELGVCLLGGACASPCVSHADCEEAERCRDLYARTADEALHPVRACAVEVRVPEGVDSSSGEVPGGLGLTPAFFPVELPGLTAGAGSYSVLVRGRTYDGEIASGSWALETRDEPPLLLFNGSRGILELAASGPVPAFLVPFDSPAYTEAGYRFLLVDYGDAPPREAVWTRLTRETAGDTLDLDFFVLEGSFQWWTVQRLEDSVEEALREILAQAGVRLGDIRGHTIAGTLAERFDRFFHGGLGQPSVEFGRLLELSAGLDRPSIPVFFVEELTDPSGCSTAGGRAGGIPGPQGIHGTESSGIVVALANFRGLDLPGVIAHEIGHFMGLRHPTERYGLLFDSLADTPECHLDRDANGDGELMADECVGAGSDNAMFFSSGGGTTITPMQAAILRSSPILR